MSGVEVAEGNAKQQAAQAVQLTALLAKQSTIIDNAKTTNECRTNTVNGIQTSQM